jgi:ubiquitin-conjugating enzyme E2 Z
MIVTRQTVSRLLKDITQIIKNPLTDNGIYYIHDNTDMLKGYALIIGTTETPYFGGYYFFELTYPIDYPHTPPKIKYCTNNNNIRFNPNLYSCGKVCVSILNTWRGEQWTSCQTISTILLTLCTLLCKNPLLNEPGVHITHKDMSNYNKIIEFSNLNIAICDIVEKKSPIFLPFFDIFYSYIIEHFHKNIDTFIQIANDNNLLFNSTSTILTTELYNMSCIINYNTLIQRLHKLKGIHKLKDL